MYRRQLVWTGFGWQYVDVFVPVNTGVFYNGYYPYVGGSFVAPGQIWAGPAYAQRGAGRLYR
jgi:hypothetical protein